MGHWHSVLSLWKRPHKYSKRCASPISYVIPNPVKLTVKINHLVTLILETVCHSGHVYDRYHLAQERITGYTTKPTWRVFINKEWRRKKGDEQACLKETWQESVWWACSLFKGSSAHGYRGLHSHATHAYKLHGYNRHVHRLCRTQDPRVTRQFSWMMMAYVRLWHLGNASTWGV